MPKPNSPPSMKFALDGREVDLLHWIYTRPDIKEISGNPAKVLAAIDEYSNAFSVLMNIGSAKGAHITSVIDQHKPSVFLELGVYVGYSAILFGQAVRSNGGKKYIGIEKNPEMAAVANQLVDLAGLRGFVQIIVGPSDEVLRELIRERNEITQVDMLMFDHWQELYRPDVWLLEELGVLVPGVTVLLADNIIMPGAPDYREWMEATPEKKRKLLKSLDVGSLRPNPDVVYETTVPEFNTVFGKVSRSMMFFTCKINKRTGCCGD
ncbi:hypothetical protein N7492_006528 [Penicillium capsulatum]|uniref:catechol O-methyltransferase n=1 Tax=Penicillium capsulatum TaxID=69766 RepID=A0A9W9I0M6_9EURO|nr:hypothetical protein N7492_006528 [Penicillium capsulatum]